MESRKLLESHRCHSFSKHSSAFQVPVLRIQGDRPVVRLWGLAAAETCVPSVTAGMETRAPETTKKGKAGLALLGQEGRWKALEKRWWWLFSRKSCLTQALQAPLSFTASQSLLKPMSIACPLSWRCCLTISFSAAPFSFCLQSLRRKWQTSSVFLLWEPQEQCEEMISVKKRNKQVFARWRVGKCIPGRKNSCAVLGMRAACSGPVEVLKAEQVVRSPILRGLVYHRKTLGFIPGKLLEDFKLGDNITRFVIQWMVSGRH